MYNSGMYQNLYGNMRTRTFADIFPNVGIFIDEYQNSGLAPNSQIISTDSATTLYYLLYARYGNSHIANSDENQFKYRVWSTIFMYGPTWEKRLEVQAKIRALTEDELRDSARAIYNHAFNPSTEPGTFTDKEFDYINEQNVTKHKRSKTDGYALLMELLKTDVTNDFINKFKKLFLVIVEPELPLWYVTELEGDIQ